MSDVADIGPKNPNPKDSIGSTKVPLHLWPTTATVLGSVALLDGALKYGRSNFRVAEVRASIYFDAANRHLNAWFEGEAVDPDSGLPHLGHALACLAIVVDAEAAGMLIDDRMVAGGYRSMITELTPHVQRLQALHADKSPKHYVIGDGGQAAKLPPEPPRPHVVRGPSYEVLLMFCFAAVLGAALLMEFLRRQGVILL